MNISSVNLTNAMRAAQVRIDNTGNNIANIHTQGFKGREITFGSVLAEEHQVLPEDADAANNRLTPQHLRIGNGALPLLHRVDFRPGEPLRTEVESDLFIEGDAFFRVSRGDEFRYTRMGSFQTTIQDGVTVLTTVQGDPVLDTNDQPIEVPAGMRLNIYTDGTVEYVNKSDASQVTTGPQIALYQVTNRQMLADAGDSQYMIPNEYVEVAGEGTKVLQGYLESSNVDLQKEMTTLMQTQRTFQFQSRALSFVDQMNEIVNNIYGR